MTQWMSIRNFGPEEWLVQYGYCFIFRRNYWIKRKLFLLVQTILNVRSNLFSFLKKAKKKKGKTQKKQKEVGNEIYQAEYSFPLVVARNYSIKYCYKSYHIIYSIKWMNMELKLWAEVSDILHTHPPFNVVFSDCMSA